MEYYIVWYVSSGCELKSLPKEAFVVYLKSLGDDCEKTEVEIFNEVKFLSII